VIPVLHSTVEKPLTAIDYIAALEQCANAREVGKFADTVPMEVRQDDRFGRAVVKRLDALKGKKKAAA
jgi:hypothetical protein